MLSWKHRSVMEQTKNTGFHMEWPMMCMWWVESNRNMIRRVCQWLTASQWFSLGTPVSSTNKIDRQEITEILLKVVLNTITLTPDKAVIQNLQQQNISLTNSGESDGQGCFLSNKFKWLGFSILGDIMCNLKVSKGT